MKKKKFNFNRFNKILFNKLFFKIIKIGSFITHLSRLKNLSELISSVHDRIVNKLKVFLTLDLRFQHFKQFRNYLLNRKNVNYIKYSFKLTIFKNKNKTKIRRYLRRFKKINFFLFFNLAFFKLILFLFLYWYNYLIIVFNMQIKSNILFNWFKPLGFLFKKYIWRKKPRNYYLKYNEINKLIFLNYKNRVMKFSING